MTNLPLLAVVLSLLVLVVSGLLFVFLLGLRRDKLSLSASVTLIVLSAVLFGCAICYYLTYLELESNIEYFNNLTEQLKEGS